MLFGKKIALASLVAVLPVGYLSLNQLNTPECGLVFDSEKRQLIQELTPQNIVRLRTERSVFADDICVMPTQKLAKAVYRINQPKPDHPGEAILFRYQQQLSEDGELNVKNWKVARDQVKQALRLAKMDAGISSQNWQSLGPGNIGGRIRSLAFDPDNTSRIYAGAVAGGVWITDDAGASWRPADDFMANLSVSTLIVDPNNSNTLYAGTGEGTFNIDQVRGLGIFKSTDKGETWSQLASTDDDYDFYWVNRITMLPDSSRLIAATHTGIWVSDDSGVNWNRTYTGRVFDVDAHPTDPTKLIAGGSGKALYSIDGGNNWTEAVDLVGNTGRVEITYARGTPDTVYASVNVNNGEIWKSIDGGQSFTLVNTGEQYLGSQGWYDNALWVDPLDSNHLIVGGIDLWRSTDGGANLTKISTWWQAPDSAHADHHFIIEHPGYDGDTNKQVYFANDGGVYTAPDITIAQDDSGWQELNNELAITQFYGIGVAPDGTVIGGTQDNGTLIFKGDSEGWYATFGGDGGWSAADPTDSNYLYGEYVYLRIHRSSNGGNGSSYIYDDRMDDNANFIAPFILDPNNPNRLLGGSDQLWVTDNAKASPRSAVSWTSIKPTIPSGSRISAIAVAQGNSDIIYVGHNDSSLYKTTNGTAASPDWQDVSGNLPQRYIMRVAIDPNDHDVVYASFGGYNNNNLWKSTDGGANWFASSTNLPPAPIRTIAIKPDDSNLIYVGTEVGIFSSENAGASWSLQNDGPANVSVDELVWGDSNTLYAATHGRGIFKTEIGGLLFNNLTDVALNSEVTSNTQTISGVADNTAISISGGEYSIGCDGNFSDAPTTVSNNDSICLRHTSSNNYWTETTTTLILGNRSFTFTSRTTPDTTPDDVTFDALVDVALNTEQTSNTVTISGITNIAPISINNGEYSINCASNGFTALTGVITNGDTLCLRHTSSTEHWQTQTTEVSIGESQFEFSSTTLPDTTPDSFSFTPISDVLIESLQTSNSVTISGIQVAVPISVTNGEYSKGCLADNFTNSDGEIGPGETVCVRHNASANYLTDTETTLDVNGETASFVSTTSADKTPDEFSFNAVTGIELSTQLTSNSVTINGLGTEVDISVSGGEYSIGCTDNFTAANGTINNGDSVCVRHTSSSSYSSTIETQLSVGRGSASFRSTTKNEPPSESGGSGGSLPFYVMLLLLLRALRQRKA